ncbi:hypothetical protein ACFSB1_00425 [Halopseudomonas phragmitis]|nr:hypothetical protein [Halopseudomonas phragmitis]
MYEKSNEGKKLEDWLRAWEALFPQLSVEDRDVLMRYAKALAQAGKG